jgi:urea ABC transporter ATP-binding protein UrtE
MSTATTVPVLDIRGVSAGYGKLKVVDGVDIVIAENESIGLIGRNGSGKTTLLKTIMGLLPAQTGSISVGGVDLTRKGAWSRCPQGIGYVPQGRLVFPRLSVEDNLALGASSSKERISDSFASVYELFPVLRSIKDRRAGALSGGQQQILAVGRALMSKPRLIILDEPTEGIQPSIIIEIAESLRHLSRERGVALLVVEQRLDFLSRVADHAHIMDRGAIVERLPFDELSRSTELQQKYLGV